LLNCALVRLISCALLSSAKALEAARAETSTFAAFSMVTLETASGSVGRGACQPVV
jgi:hypothetical protein